MDDLQLSSTHHDGGKLTVWRWKYIPGTAGQVWSLVEYDDTLFCCHHLGTFIVNDDRVLKIPNTQGSWQLKPLNKKNLILQEIKKTQEQTEKELELQKKTLSDLQLEQAKIESQIKKERDLISKTTKEQKIKLNKQLEIAKQIKEKQIDCFSERFVSKIYIIYTL